ncbi:hypothetical protein NDU88_002152 [Pleurodeles waltl]|uniref:Uncharacterized protein n=1 Tax=Pleurodeles waltl TaxID=8319 RepID=A0AAV7L2Y1_PLEWA|nr:hypothetical protein NDU88_002152 [Pleurodeles waltl]
MAPSGPIIYPVHSRPNRAGGSQRRRGDERHRWLFPSPWVTSSVRIAAQGEPTETVVVRLATGEYATQRRAAEEKGPERLRSWRAAAGVPRLLGVPGALQMEMACRGRRRRGPWMETA